MGAMSEDNFFHQLKNFSKLFARNLTPTPQNSVEIIFATNSINFIQALKNNINFEKYKNLDIEMSFIEVDEEGQTRIFLAHKNKLLELNMNGIEIFISEEIYIDWFGQTHSRHDIQTDRELNKAIKIIKDNLDFPSKIINISWRGQNLAGGIWRKERRDFDMVKYFRPLIFVKKIFLRGKNKTKIFYVDWKPADNNKQITKK